MGDSLVVELALVDLMLVDLMVANLTVVDFLVVDMPVVDLTAVDLTVVDSLVVAFLAVGFLVMDILAVDLTVVDLTVVDLTVVDLTVVDLTVVDLTVADLTVVVDTDTMALNPVVQPTAFLTTILTALILCNFVVTGLTRRMYTFHFCDNRYAWTNKQGETTNWVMIHLDKDMEREENGFSRRGRGLRKTRTKPQISGARKRHRQTM
ncbi:hypothetical protein K490DRAFT_53283 [Saccharata proteae CBS 121410]|uniref:Uncharacterized protein n=1 Tax=Saccharata proteae CBS 121410 TaxID=1314787 RepID=A0A9P4HZG0_9PEZI|nr:hypothetical protein K490DRAFT_53283 [Saccharata proteae CBS 121410]